MEMPQTYVERDLMVMDNPKPTNTLLSIQSRQSYPTKVVVPFASFYSTFFLQISLDKFPDT